MFTISFCLPHLRRLFMVGDYQDAGITALEVPFHFFFIFWST